MRKGVNAGLAGAMTLLIQNQAAYVSDMRETQKEFALIRRRLDEIEARLVSLQYILAGLPEAIGDIRQKIGFKSP